MQIARRRTRWMPEPAWEVLRLCAVLGELSAADLARLSGCPLRAVLTSVDNLMHANLVISRPDGLVGHRSTLMREAIAEQVSPPSRLHLRETLAAIPS